MRTIDKKLLYHIMFASTLLFNIIFTIGIVLLNFTGEEGADGELIIFTVFAVVNLAAILCCLLCKERIIHFVSIMAISFIMVVMFIIICIYITDFDDTLVQMIFAYWLINIISSCFLVKSYIDAYRTIAAK